MRRIRRATRWMVAVAAIIAGVTLARNRETVLRALMTEHPVRYDQPFHPAVKDADRIVVRADGFDCCRPVEETNILFQVEDPAEVAEVRSHIEFEARTTTNAFLETCLCCGGPGIDWYQGKKRIALTALMHGRAIRWRGFSTTRLAGFRVGCGDGPLTPAAREWLAEWLHRHGADPGTAGAAVNTGNEP